MSIEPDDEPEEQALSCDSCGKVIADELFWTDGKGEVLCEKCIPPTGIAVGVIH